MKSYITDAAEIYRRSFATIRSEADLAGMPASVATVAVRMIHACGMVDLTRDIAYSENIVTTARAALQAGGPILCDARMVAAGVARHRLPAHNPVITTIDDPRVPDLAARLETTRSAAALELWRDKLAGAVVAIGNAPTALFRLFELLDDQPARPAAIIGMPVGFVGAAESKAALVEHPAHVEYLTIRGRRGGSAVTAAAINAIASAEE
jgi:precorrin-8X/cobalt-precorrin-8 methylmutase